MPHYLRKCVPGGCYFSTVNLRDRRSSLLVERIDLLRECVRRARLAAPFHVDAWVVLPDHMHCIWTLPEGVAGYSSRWLRIKQRFSTALPKIEARTAVMAARGDRSVWQRRFWEHTIRDELDYARHMDYVHFNPVKHGLAENPAAGPIPRFAAPWRWGFTRNNGWVRVMAWRENSENDQLCLAHNAGSDHVSCWPNGSRQKAFLDNQGIITNATRSDGQVGCEEHPTLRLADPSLVSENLELCTYHSASTRSLHLYRVECLDKPV